MPTDDLRLTSRRRKPPARREGHMVLAAVAFVLGAQIVGALLGVLGAVLWHVTR